MRHFGSTLSQLRRDAGFATAYAFYHRNGGRRIFRYTFAHYRKIERGLSLPPIRSLPVIISCLRSPLDSADVRRLAIALLRDLVGDEQVFADLIEPLIVKDGGSTGERSVVHRLLTTHAKHLSVRQYRSIASSPERFWIFHFLSNNRGPVALARLAAALARPAPRLRRAAEELVEQRVLRRAGKERYACPFAGSHVVSPNVYPGYLEDARRIRGYYSAMAKGGVRLARPHILLRLGPRGQKEVPRILSDALERVLAHGTVDGEEGSAMVHVGTIAQRFFVF